MLGYSGKAGMREPRGFPAWATIPSYRDLADGRRWHFFFAWLFVINGLVYWLMGLIGGHIRQGPAAHPRRAGAAATSGMRSSPTRS